MLFIYKLLGDGSEPKEARAPHSVARSIWPDVAASSKLYGWTMILLCSGEAITSSAS